MAETSQSPSQPEQADQPAADARAERHVARLAKRIGAFAGSHGGSAEGQIAYVGEVGTRILLVGSDGTWGDLVAPSYEIAERAVEASGIARQDSFDGEMAAKVRTGPYEWKRMAGIQVGGSPNT
ncbi:hypothetical protein K7472_21685 [Streptomyces sp. PTM05]|uniref:Uncharacterized protein n=1 Tax=Streptantibioticus parmotrematis TaxID=2873249 RepID=A0ABS7R075_9ACTN|nr:hypothetical protein [Streptantibioticus parmotrematis]MBY8887429.1 hypothetical protein [Streptantibioticus parmotrematis]